MGAVDGSLNNAHVLDHANILGAMVNSKIGDEANNNANTRTEGKTNFSDDQGEAEDSTVSKR